MAEKRNFQLTLNSDGEEESWIEISGDAQPKKKVQSKKRNVKRPLQDLPPLRSSVDPRKELEDLLKKKADIGNELANVERQLYEFEGSCLAEANFGNFISGLDKKYLATKRTVKSESERRTRKVKDAHRFFSRSSITSMPAVKGVEKPYLPQGSQVSSSLDDQGAMPKLNYRRMYCSSSKASSISSASDTDYASSSTSNLSSSRSSYTSNFTESSASVNESPRPSSFLSPPYTTDYPSSISTLANESPRPSGFVSPPYTTDYPSSSTMSNLNSPRSGSASSHAESNPSSPSSE